MKNKDWREQFKQEFGIHFSDSEFSFAIASTESLLKSKQEEIEKVMKNMKKTGYGFDLEGMANFGSPSTVKSKNEQIYNQALDDLKPIISNILLK